MDNSGQTCRRKILKCFVENSLSKVGRFSTVLYTMDAGKAQTNSEHAPADAKPPDGKRKQGQTSGEQGNKQRGQKRPKQEGNGAKGGEDKGGMESAPGGKNLQTYVQILGTDTGDTCPSVMVFSQNCRYLFNVGDGLQVSIFQAPTP